MSPGPTVRPFVGVLSIVGTGATIYAYGTVFEPHARELTVASALITGIAVFLSAWAQGHLSRRD